jgi:predicted transcriptional regulator
LSEIEIAAAFDEMNRVVEELLKGNNPTQIARELGMTRATVLQHIDSWKELINGDTRVRERAKEALAGADQHYAMIIKRAWETVEQADMNNQLSNKTAALKLVADIEQKRMDMLHKAGVLEDSELAGQILETGRKQEILMNILKEVTANCDHCKVEVARRLSQATNKIEDIRIIDQ